MTKIKDYNNDSVLSSGDKWIGSDADSSSTTKNFTLGAVAAFVETWISDGGDPDLNQRILVTYRQAGAIIDGQGVADDNVAKAINRSFKGGITVSKYEILVVEIQRQKVNNTGTAKGFTLLTEQYYYASGEGVINGDSVESDWILDYSGVLAEDTGKAVLAEDPITWPIGWSDTSAPDAAVNGNSELITLNPSVRQEYFIVYNTTDQTDFKIYEYTGPAGDYGSGPDTIDLADFTEIVKSSSSYRNRLSEFINDGDGTNPFLTIADDKLVSVAAVDSITGKRYSLIDTDAYGFLISKSVDGRVGYDALNDNAGASSLAGLVARTDSAELYRNYAMIAHFGASHGAAYLQSKGAVFSDDTLFFLAGYDGGFDFRSGPTDTLNTAGWNTSLLQINADGTIVAPSLAGGEVVSDDQLTNKKYVDSYTIPLKSATTTISAASLKTLGTTEVDLLGALGVSSKAIVTGIMIESVFGTTPFDTVELVIKYDGGSVINDSFFLDFGSDVSEYYLPDSPVLNIPTNTKIVASGTDSIATGDSPITVTIYYIKRDIGV